MNIRSKPRLASGNLTASNPDVTRLFDDPRAEERDYWQRTGIHPIMHMVVIREELYRENSWIATSMFDAFERPHRGGERLR